jgi:hypothetical protein
MKTKLITFFNIKGAFHFEFIPRGQTVNQAYYVETVKLYLGKGLNFGPMTGFSSTEGAVKQFLAQKSITEVENPPCSPDLVPNDFWLFPKIKYALKG